MNPSIEDPYFATRFQEVKGRAGVWREIARYVARDLSGRTSLLEIGPGYCDFINQIGVRDKYAIDISSSAEKYANDDVRITIGDCSDLSFLSGESVENVFASNVLEHLDRDRLGAVAAEVMRVLKPGGRVLILQPNFRLCYANYFDDYTHLTVFSDLSLRDFLRAHGFHIARCVPGLLPFSMKSRLPKWPFMVRVYLRSPVRPMAKQMYVVAEKPRQGSP